MDQDLVNALGANPTPLERLYAEAIEDSRAGVVKWDQERQRLADWRATAQAWMDWFKAEYGKLPAETFTENDRLYERCIQLGIQTRSVGQAMSTSTTRTVMDDVVNDGFYIGEQIYARILAHRETPPGQ